MSDELRTVVLKLMDSGCKVFAWLKPEGVVLRIRKNQIEKWALVVDGKLVASL